MILKRIGPLSLGKIMGIMYAIMGLFFGILFAAIVMFAFIVGSTLEGSSEPLAGVLFGIGAVFAAPILYGLMGFIGGVVAATIYNFVVKFTGGLELDFEGEAAAPSQG
jgi:hypothetical protein